MKIAIIRLSALGDIIHTIPAVYLIKKKYPQAEITWFVNKGNERLLDCFEPFVKIETIALKNKTIKEVLKEISRLRKLFKNHFDIILDFQGLIKSAFISFILGKVRIGFHKKNLRESISSLFYNNSPKIFDEEKHIIYKNIHLTNFFFKKFLNLSKNTNLIEYPELKVFKSEKLINFMDKNNLKKDNFILINIGGGWETKTLSIKQYENLINSLKNKHKIIILWGNEKEKNIAEILSKRTNIIKSEFLKFNELFKIIALSKFIITSDTLALHIADTIKTRSIGIFGPTSPKRNGSLNSQSTVVYKQLECSPCHKKRCIDLKCINHITTEDILKKIKIINEQT